MATRLFLGLQVLSILDSTAMSWPGLQQAIDDLQFLVDMSSQTTSELELEHSNLRSALQEYKAENKTLKETLAMQAQGKEDLQRKLDETKEELQRKLDETKEELQRKYNELAQEHRSLAAQHALATKEVQQQKQVRMLKHLILKFIGAAFVP